MKRLKSLIYPNRAKQSQFLLEKSLVLAFLISYFLASQLILPYYGKKRIYPFFNFSLFSSCNPQKTVLELEISFLNKNGNRVIITNKNFGWGYIKIFYRMRTMAEARQESNKKKEDTALGILLNKVSWRVPADEFEYKIFKSQANIIDYAQSKALIKETLFREGQFKKEAP